MSRSPFTLEACGMFGKGYAKHSFLSADKIKIRESIPPPKRDAVTLKRSNQLRPVFWGKSNKIERLLVMFVPPVAPVCISVLTCTSS